ncbi:MAG: glycerophosphodiester phosphodiesterase family protein [bacterium]|nr:glycerophosphodiester phosphodiesterase family protein [bacterium]
MKIKRNVSVIVMIVMIVMMTGMLVAGGDKEAKANYRTFKDAAALRAYLTWKPDRQPLISAHRGGPMENYPENAIETFEYVLKYGPCLIECDVSITKDGKLVMMHDETLDRTTNGKGLVSDHTLAELRKLHLIANNKTKTTYRIPTFGEVLEWAKGRSVLTVDVKKGVDYSRIVGAIREHKAEGHAVVIVYRLEDILKVHKLAPDLMISASARGIKGAEKLLASNVPLENICAFVGVYEPDLKVYEMLHKKGIYTVLGTMHNLDNKAAARGYSVYSGLYKNGADILSTANVPLVSKAIKNSKQKAKH